MYYTLNEIVEIEKETRASAPIGTGDEVNFNGERFEVVAVKGEYATIEEIAPEDGKPIRKRVKLGTLERIA